MKRTRTIASYFTPASTPIIQSNQPSSIPTQETELEPEIEIGEDRANNVEQTIPNFVSNGVVADPGLRVPIEELDPNIRDDIKREYILMGPCQPKGHTYPPRIICGRNRRFQEDWFKDRAWLEYSVAKDAAFCFYCFLFKQPRAENFGVDSFTNVGFRGWKDGRKIIEGHDKGTAHNNARRHYEDYKNQRQSVSRVISVGTKKMESEYKSRMIVILEIIRFILLQGLAFRGHDESSSSDNKGNFLEMIEWYKQRDKDAAYLLRNNQMTSPLIQKDLCRACAEQTSKAIIQDIGDRNFSVLVDEARDVSVKEQMAVILRYVNARGQVIERFLGAEEVADTTSYSLKQALDAVLTFHGLSIARLRGQGYDGASNMRGEFHGLQRRILNENPYAFYIHCFAHQLLLVVVSVAKSCSSVFDFFHTSTLIVNTVNASCKRRDQLAQQHYENLLSMLDGGEIFSGSVKNQETNLVRPGDTRWGSHHKTLCRILHMWDAVLEVLEIISDDATSGEKKYKASKLLKEMGSFEFVFILHLMIRLLSKTNDLSQCLQRKDQNIFHAIGLIGTTLQKMNEIRENGWEELFTEVENFCLLHNIIVPNMEDTLTVRGRARGRGGQLVTHFHHLKNEIFNVVHDQIILELNNRFAERSTQLLRCIACLDPRNSFANFDEDKLVELAEIYAADFSQYDCIVLRNQLEMFVSDARADANFTCCNDLGDLAVKMVQTDRHKVFPLVYRLIELALILPVATATVERAFSAMKIIKTELRNKMGGDWLNHRMVCYIERDTFASIANDDILYHFQDMKSRKNLLPKQPPTGVSGSHEETRS